MAENVTNELILEHLKNLQTRFADMASDISVLKDDVRAVKGHMALFMQAEARHDGELASLRHRIERIERRLELVDDPGQ